MNSDNMTDEQILDLARADGWDYDTSPDTEMSNEIWWRFDPCTAARTEEDLIEHYRTLAWVTEIG